MNLLIVIVEEKKLACFKRSTQNRQEWNLISLTFTVFLVFKQFILSIWHILYLRMIDDAIKHRFIELSVIILVVFVRTSLENLL